MNTPEKRLVVGTPISTVTNAETLDFIDLCPKDRAQVIAFCNVHSVMAARQDPTLAQALQATDIAAPDGMPLTWALKAVHGIDQERVRGPSFMKAALLEGTRRGWRHYFFGTNDDTLIALAEAVKDLAPEAHIVGSLAPPYRPMTDEEERNSLELIRSSKANLVWVGLGMPKQELWMARVSDALPGVTLLGVGAAFDLLAGNQPEAPNWMQHAGLEWLFRLWREPRRLWRRYLFNNPAYLLLLAARILRSRLSRS